MSEKVSFENRHTQTFNSLFIWDKDKVIRIVFLYDRKFPLLSKPIISRLRSFESFLPTFKRCTWDENPKYKSNKVFIAAIQIYNENFKHDLDNDAGGEFFTYKLKTFINTRNKKYNPLADKFGSIIVYDGDPEVMVYNEKRKGKEINNFPLLINSPKGDSSFIISPVHIDVYRKDKSEKNRSGFSKKVTCYKLYSTVSFLQQLIEYQTEKEIVEPYKRPLNNVITGNTLSYLYKVNSPMDSGSLMNELLQLPFSERKTVYDNVGTDESKIYRIGKLSKKDSIRMKEDSVRKKVDSVKAREVIKLRFLKGFDFGYQYCAECYDNEIPKEERIQNHCPLKIAEYENWGYAFSEKYRHYFEVEQPLRSSAYVPTVVYSNEEMHLNKWLMMSPGVGYWMSDVVNYDNQYSTKFDNLFLNGKKISQ